MTSEQVFAGLAVVVAAATGIGVHLLSLRNRIAELERQLAVSEGQLRRASTENVDLMRRLLGISNDSR